MEMNVQIHSDYCTHDERDIQDILSEITALILPLFCAMWRNRLSRKKQHNLPVAKVRPAVRRTFVISPFHS